MSSSKTKAYDPYARGPFPAGARTIEITDPERSRTFPSEIWYPAAPDYAGKDLLKETQDCFTDARLQKTRSQQAVRNAEPDPANYPLILFSHASGGGRLSATFLCTHLASHGYIVAAMDHSEMVAPELARNETETADQKRLRIQGLIASRVPDLRFLLEHLLNTSIKEIRIDQERIGLVGHSFGGWTVLATPDVEPRIQTIVALAPGGASHPKPGILPATLTFDWKRRIPTLYLVAENDVCLPLQGMYELFERTPGKKQMIILRHADHAHFMDNVEELHEAMRNMPLTGELAWLPKEMQPITELCSGEEAHRFTRGLTVAHLDATLKNRSEAAELLAGM